MPWHPKLIRTGKPLTYNQQVAQAMNWWRRCIMGLRGQINFQSGYFITSAPEYVEMSNARKKALRDIELQKTIVRTSMDTLIQMIDDFSRLPIDITREEKGVSPKRRIRKKEFDDMPF